METHHSPPLVRGGDRQLSGLNKGGVLITGGAGFIGCNTAQRLIQEGYNVFILDNLSRPGVEANLKWLRTVGKFTFIRGDIRNDSLLKKIFKNNKFCCVLHLAAQVAVTTSVKYPVEDFEINAMGTLNLLEAVRKSNQNPVFIYSSTNKVYGALDGITVKELKSRYSLVHYPRGIPDNYPLDFHSPYGCSKGSADQYVRDYGRIYGMNTVVLRQSCIYGPHQFGIEDQGWVAWFIIQALKEKTITIYGNGKQVRDLLFIDDLVELYVKILKKMNSCATVYNVGGGSKNTLSLLEFIKILREIHGKKINVKFFSPRPGDQRVFVCDIRKVEKEQSWHPKISVREGILHIYKWLKENT